MLLTPTSCIHSYQPFDSHKFLYGEEQKYIDPYKKGERTANRQIAIDIDERVV